MSQEKLLVREHFASGAVGVNVSFIEQDHTRAKFEDEFEVALVFSQDQDLSEVADEIRVIAREQSRWIKIA